MALSQAIPQNRSTRTFRERRQKSKARPASAERHERRLVERYRAQGDTAARDQLIERLMPLAQNLARRYHRPDTSFDDLVQVACIGLIKAVDRFDPGRGTALSSYAVPTVLGELKRYFRDTTWSLHVPRDMQERVMHVSQTTESLSSRFGRSPTPAEIAEEIDDSTENVLEAMEAAGAYDAVSLESGFESDDDEGEPFVNQIGTQDGRFEFIEEAASISGQLEALPQREREVLALRFIHDMTQTQIAQHIGVSQMHVSRLIKRALARVHSGSESELETANAA